MSSPMSGKRTLDKVIGYCQTYDINTAPAKGTGIKCWKPDQKVVRVGNIAFDCHSHDTGADVRGWIIDGTESYQFLAVPYWYSSHYTFNSSRWEKGAWDGAVDEAIAELWKKADAHRKAKEVSKAAEEAARQESADNLKKRFERQFTN